MTTKVGGWGLRLCALALGTILAVPSATVLADGDSHTPCERTAKRMHRACSLDVREEFNITIANCLNIADAADRQACREEAWVIREEGPEACEVGFEARLEVCDLLNEFRYDPEPLLDPANAFVDPNDVPDVWPANPLQSIEEGLVPLQPAHPKDLRTTPPRPASST